MFSKVSQQSFRSGLALVDAGHELHHRLDLFSKIDVGYAEDCRIGNPGVGNQEVFAFLGVNVHAPGDDHEGFPVREIKEAIVIHVTHIPHRGMGAVGGGGFLGFLRVVVIREF